MSKPIFAHLEAAKRVLRYIKGTLHHGICFSPSALTLTAFSNVDWAGDPTNRHSTTGLLVFLGPNPISLSAKKQNTMSRSFTEVEYRALATSAVELSWLWILFKELKIFLPYIPVIWCDNFSAKSCFSFQDKAFGSWLSFYSKTSVLGFVHRIG